VRVLNGFFLFLADWFGGQRFTGKPWKELALPEDRILGPECRALMMQNFSWDRNPASNVVQRESSWGSEPSVSTEFSTGSKRSALVEHCRRSLGLDRSSHSVGLQNLEFPDLVQIDGTELTNRFGLDCMCRPTAPSAATAPNEEEVLVRPPPSHTAVSVTLTSVDNCPCMPVRDSFDSSTCEGLRPISEESNLPSVPGEHPDKAYLFTHEPNEASRGSTSATLSKIVSRGLMQETSGSIIMEQEMRQHWPCYVGCQCLMAAALWTYSAIETTAPLNVQTLRHARGGLDWWFPGKTVMLINHECEDFRHEAWRNLTYQFTHGDMVHVLMNMFMVVFLGVPLEGFHGHWRLMAIFNLGVIGGACLHNLCNPHLYPLIGMSAGCYALMAMHLSDLVINWRQTRFRWLKFLMLVSFALADLIDVLSGGSLHQPLSTGHFAHAGGYTGGMLTGFLLGKDIKAKEYKTTIRVVAVTLSFCLIAFYVWWVEKWPPRAIWDTLPFCWVHQVQNETVFGNKKWNCLTCKDKACVQEWKSTQQHIARVALNLCGNLNLDG